MEVTIELDQFKLTVEITHLINDAPDPTCRDSADDCRGTRELEWVLVYAVEYDDNGRIKQCGSLQPWLYNIADKYNSEITDAIWAKYDEGQPCSP